MLGSTPLGWWAAHPPPPPTAPSSVPGLFSWHPMLMSLAVSSGPGRGGREHTEGWWVASLRTLTVWRGDMWKVGGLPVAHAYRT